MSKSQFQKVAQCMIPCINTFEVTELEKEISGCQGLGKGENMGVIMKGQQEGS